MHQIPDKVDLEDISRACDRVLMHMRTYRVDEDTLHAIGVLCAFVARMKKDIEWIESMMQVMKMKDKNGSSEDKPETHED